jgi:hypothetical protein
MPHRRRERIVAAAAALGTLLVASAHVGTSNAYFEGVAGPYPVRVIVRTPGVIPGLAQISVRVTGDAQPRVVTVRPLRWDAGLEGAPPPDTARAVPGEPGLYAAELWLMTTGSYSVRVSAVGDAGEGVALVPVNAVAERRLDMNRGMAAALLAAALFLFVGAVTIFGAAVRESVLEPGTEPSPARRLGSVWAMLVGGSVLALALWGGWRWWDSVDRAYRAGMFRPLATSSSVAGSGVGAVLTLSIDDPSWRGRQWTPLIPDHGKLMHMFLVRDDLEAFAHLHPESADSSSFATVLPQLPPGVYRIYADIVHESGFAQTLVDTVRVGSPSASPPAARQSAADPDDSWAVLPPHGGAEADAFTLPSGRRAEWLSGRAPRLDEEVTLAFRVSEPDGTPATLEDYMGMLGHAAVTRVDGSVFVHVHPAGSIRMAAMERFAAAGGGAGGGSTMSMPGMAGTQAMEGAATGTTAGAEGMVGFPFVFPAAGAYRVFVQVKVAGVVETAAFDVAVAPTS